jgi:Zn finger protein HypA/HybF involved in hydrogenase expression
MAAITAWCPKCKQMILVPVDALKVKCPNCHQVVKIANPDKTRTKDGVK